MNRWLGLIGVLAGFVAPQAAQAEPSQWGDHKAPIPVGETRELGVAGTLTVRVLTPSGKLMLKAACATTGVSTFRNEGEHGRGETKTIRFGCTEEKTKACAGSTVVIKPALLPWPAILEASSTLFFDEWHGVSLGIRCARGTNLGTFAGTLTPKIGDGADDGIKDDVDDHLIFNAERGSLLEPSSGDVATTTGMLTIEGKRIQPLHYPEP